MTLICDTVIVQIKLSTKSFGIEAATVAARAIENVANSLTHADISDIIAGRPEKEVLGALQIISQSLAKAKLKALDLSDNALGQKGIIACTQAFAQQVHIPEALCKSAASQCTIMSHLSTRGETLQRFKHIFTDSNTDTPARQLLPVSLTSALK